MRLIGVGVGPGDPELLTLKAVRVLASAGRVFVPVLALDEPGRAEATIAAHVPPERVERLVFALNERHDPERRYAHWDAAGARVAGWLAGSGGTAAFATIGDPNLYSTFGYLAQTVRGLRPEVAVETVPGITAMQALASASGVPLAEGRERLTLLPATAGLDRFLEPDGTVVVYKGFRDLPSLDAAVREAGRRAIYGERLGLPGERVAELSTVVGRSGSPDAAVPNGEAPYLSTVLIPARRDTRGGKL